MSEEVVALQEVKGDSNGGRKESSTSRHLEYNVRRPVYNYADFNATHGEAIRTNRPLLDCARDALKQKCTANGAVSLLGKLVPPPIDMLRSRKYALSDLVSDVIAGLTMCVFHIPQGLAYGMLAGLKPVNGLYTSLIPVFIFAIFGRSRHLSIGTFAVMSLILLDMVEDNYESYLSRIDESNGTAAPLPMNFTDVEYAKLQTAIVGSFAASIIVMVIGLLRLGFFMRYVSDSMLKGFTTAAGVHVLLSQLSLIFGVKIPRTRNRFKIISTLINFFKVIRFTNFVTLGLSAGCCIVLYVVKEYVAPVLKKKTKVPLPIELIIIVIVLLASVFGQFNERFNVAIVGEVPRGLPSPLVPDMGFLPRMFPSAIPVGIVGSAITLSLAKMYCLEFQYSYDLNEDFVILGVSSMASSFFQCFFACGALARNAVVVSVGMKSQIASFVSCVCMLTVLLAVGPLFHSLPTCVLGSIIAVISFINVIKQTQELPGIWKISRIDFSVWVVAAAAVLILDVTFGLAIGFGYTLFSVVLRTQSPRIAILGQIEGTDIYKNVLVYPSASELPGVKIVRFDAPLNFANAERFRDFLVRLGNELTGVDTDAADAPPVHTIVLDCSSWVYADMVGVRIAKETYKTLRKLGYRVLFASCKESVRLHFFLEGFFKEVDKSLFFLTLHDTVLYAVNVPPPPLPPSPSAGKSADEGKASAAKDAAASAADNDGGVAVELVSADAEDANPSVAAAEVGRLQIL